MPNFKNMTDEQLGPWVNGHNSLIGSLTQIQAQQEWDERMNVRKIETFDSYVAKLIAEINSLKETWKTKFLWFVIVAIVVGILIELASHLIISFLKI